MRTFLIAGAVAASALIAGSAAAQAASPSDALTVTARMVEAPAGPGASGRFDVTLSVAEGWSITDAGIPGAVLQIDPPDDLTLAGEVITEHRALARNEFLHAPFERMIQLGDTPIEFSIGQVTDPNDLRIGINVAAYLRHGDDAPAHFFRTRLELPITAEAAAVKGDATDTSWGDERSGMQIGDTAQLFTLPRADGTQVDLKEYVGKKNIIVTTYRAFW